MKKRTCFVGVLAAMCCFCLAAVGAEDDLLQKIQNLRKGPAAGAADDGVMYTPSGRICPPCSQVPSDQPFQGSPPQHRLWLSMFTRNSSPEEDVSLAPDWQADLKLLTRGGNSTRLIVLTAENTNIEFLMTERRHKQPDRIGLDWNYPVQVYSLRDWQQSDERSRVASAFRCQSLADDEFLITLPKAVEVYNGDIVGVHYGDTTIVGLVDKMDLSCTPKITYPRAPRADGLLEAPDCKDGICRPKSPVK